MKIMFNDLTSEAQKRLLSEAGVSSPEEMNWDAIPVAVVEFEDKGHDSDEDLLEEELLDDTYDFDDDGTLY